MNKNFVSWNLEEATEAISAILTALKDDAEYDYPEYWVDMRHLYDHINVAWNARDATEEQATACKAEDYNRWGQLPQDLPMSVDPDTRKAMRFLYSTGGLESAGKLLEGKVISKIFYSRVDELCVEFTDNERIFIGIKDKLLEISVDETE
jgi:hypothetical protein